MQFGRSSERLASSIAQFELALEDLEEQQALTELNDAAPVAPVIGDNGLKPARRPLPEHLPRARLSTIPRRVPVHVAVANSVASERM
jgi:transposase